MRKHQPPFLCLVRSSPDRGTFNSRAKPNSGKCQAPGTKPRTFHISTAPRVSGRGPMPLLLASATNSMVPPNRSTASFGEIIVPYQYNILLDFASTKSDVIGVRLGETICWMARQRQESAKEAFARRLRVAREAAGYETMRAFAAALGIAEATYRRYEAAETEPGIEKLSDIAELTGASLDFLIRGHISRALMQEPPGLSKGH